MQKNHPFHLVPPSPWPFAISMALILFGVGAVLAMHKVDYILLGVGIVAICLVVTAWFIDILKESRENGTHNKNVQLGLKIGFALFIASEVMLFFSFFWAYFNAALDPIVFTDEQFVKGVWPPKDIKVLDPFDLPYLNTLLLLLSGTTLTWAHHELLIGRMKEVKKGILLTVLLGLLFSSIQAFEYAHAAFKFTDGIYASTFYMATGLHGAHVILGTILLIVCYVRCFNDNDITPVHHVGFETAAWYWHFVDVVWLFLFVSIYWWPYKG